MWKYYPIFQLNKSKSIYLYIYSFVFHVYSFYSTEYFPRDEDSEFLFRSIYTTYLIKLFVYVMNIFKVSCGFIKGLVANA